MLNLKGMVDGKMLAARFVSSAERDGGHTTSQ